MLGIIYSWAIGPRFDWQNHTWRLMWKLHHCQDWSLEGRT